MLTLEKSLKVLKLNRKPTGKWKSLKEGDIMNVSFEVSGIGGSSPKVDIFINQEYSHNCFAREFNDLFYRGKKKWDGNEYITLPVIAELEEI